MNDINFLNRFLCILAENAKRCVGPRIIVFALLGLQKIVHPDSKREI